MKSSRHHLLRRKTEEHVVADLDLRIDENRFSLTSSVVAEERQDVSSKNTINEMADTITGDIGLWALWSAKYTRKNVGILVEI